MDEKSQGFVESVAFSYPVEDERSKVTMVFKKKNKHGDVNVRHKLGSDDSDENDSSSEVSIAKTKKEDSLQRRLSTEVVTGEKDAERSSSPTKNDAVISYPTLVPFCLPKEPAGDVDKYQDIIKASESELKDVRLTQLSSERDRSISVERSSSSSREEIISKNVPKDGSDKRAADIPKDIDKKDKESSRSKEIRKRESSADKSRSRSKLSRSTSRSPSRHRRKESPLRHRSRDRHRDRDRSPRRTSRGRRSRSPRRYSRDRNRRSRSRGRRSRSRGYRSRSRERHNNSRNNRHRSRSFERRRYRDRSSSRDRYRKRRHTRSRSRSRGRSAHDRSKSRLTGLDKVASLTLPTTAGPMTPQMALQQTMAAMSAKAQALTGIELPKYYNPAAVNPLKYAEQVQKRKLLWEAKKETTQEQPKNTIWDKLTFQQDQDGKMTEKFRKLMGIKAGAANEETKEIPEPVEAPTESAALQNQEELFRNLDQQYEMARMSTHTHRGVGLGYSSQAIFPPIQKP